MSTPADFMQQALGGLLNYQTQQSPLSGLLSGSDPTANFGLSLMANSNSGGHFGQILGKSALDTQQLGMQNALNRLQLAKGAMGLQQQIGLQKSLSDYLEGLGQGAQGAQPSSPSQGATAQGTQPTVQTSTMPTSLLGATSDIANTPVNGVPPDIYRRLAAQSAVASGKTVNPLEIEKQLRADQIAAAQDKVRPQLDAIDTLVGSDKPTQYVMADPQALALWKQTAPRLGMNPATDFTDQNVKTALTYARNEAASRVNLPINKPNIPLLTKTLPDGRTEQIDPVSGKVTIEAASPLVKVVGKDGKPVFVPEGKAAGMRPYNEQTAASDDALQATAEDVANYKIPPPSGSKLLSGNWPEVMRQVKGINPDYDATQYATKNRARQQFATGKQGDIVRSLSVATDHLDQLSQAADAMKNGQLPVANSVVNFFSKQTGNPNVTNFDAMKEIVGDEVVKAVVGATGAAGDREAIKKTFASANSPAQLQGVIQKYKGLMGGQLRGLRQQYERTTGLKDFDSAISPQAEAELNPPAAVGAHPADIAALLDKYK